MRASPHKIKVFILIMAVMGTKISHLEDIMSKAPENGTSGDIARIFPVFWSIADFKFNMFFDVPQTLLFKPFYYCFPGCFLYLLPVLMVLLINMPCRNDN